MQHTTEPIPLPTFDASSSSGTDDATRRDPPAHGATEAGAFVPWDDPRIVFLRRLDERSVDAAIWVAHDGAILYANRVAAQWLGHSADRLVGLNFVELAESLNASQWQRRQGEIMRGGCARFETRLRCCDGAILPVEIAADYVELDDCNWCRLSARDITHCKAAERQMQEYVESLKTANERLEQYSFSARAATRAKSDFLASMSHEIRTPLTAIIGFAETILVDGDIDKAPPERIDAIHTIIRNGQYLLELISDILDLSKIEAGRLEVERISCDPFRVVSDVLRIICARAEMKQIRLQTDYPEPLPEAVRTDPTRLRQILLNLLGNAVKFTSEGSITLRVRLERGPAEDDNQMVFEVIDTGIGMTPEQIDGIFQPYTQAETSIMRRFGGTGLGLSICKQLCERLGGTIEVESEPGRGSVFRASIAIGSIRGAVMIDPGKRRCSGSASAVIDDATPPPLAGRILLAEDAPDSQRLLSMILRKAGADVVVVGDGRAACETAVEAWRSARPFHLILMDMQMPILTGYEAARHLRNLGYPHPIVALTANAMAGERERCLAAGCNGYACKPIDRVGFLRTAAEHLGPRRPAADHAVETGELESTLHEEPLVSTARTNPNLVELLANYVEGLPARAEALQEAYQANEKDVLLRLARNLRTTAAVYGFQPIAEAARTIEMHSDHTAERVRKAVNDIAALCRRAIF